MFDLYDAPIGGNLLGTHAHFGVTVTNGLFTVTLNDNGEFGPNVFNGDARWLEILVNFVPMSPRQEITATPYALQTRGIFVDDTGDVGIGTTNPGWKLHVAGQCRGNTTRSERKRRRRRSAVEPKIGHLKSDHRMDRCYLTGLEGDAINATLAAAGSNLRKLLRRLAAALIRWLRIVVETASITVHAVPNFAVPASKDHRCA